MKKSHSLLLVASLLFVAGCRHGLPESRLAGLLTDMYLYDEELARDIKGVDSVSLYRSVFARHGCSEEEYRDAIARYAGKPKVMREIYEAVKARLENYRAKLEHESQLEEYMRTAPPPDTLYYTPLNDDSTRRVYLPKFRLQPAQADTVLAVIPERPEQLKQPKQADKLMRPLRRQPSL
jgi:hypothetical protein